jgi:hypothetical protein
MSFIALAIRGTGPDTWPMARAPTDQTSRRHFPALNELLADVLLDDLAVA